MSFFSDRSNSPGTVTYEVSDGAIREEVARTVDPGFVRELEATIMISPATANYIAKWIKSHLEAIGWKTDA